MHSILYLDMDGVLTDFVKGSFRVHGVDPLPPCQIDWNYFTQLKNKDGEPMTAKEFYAPMDFQFWHDLEWTAEGQEFLGRAESVFGQENIVLLTAPAETEGGTEGKIAWIRKHLPKYTKQYFVGPDKAPAASPWHLLADDSQENWEKFLVRGGRGVLIPRPWNSRRKRTNALGHFDPVQMEVELRYEHKKMTYGRKAGRGCLV